MKQYNGLDYLNDYDLTPLVEKFTGKNEKEVEGNHRTGDLVPGQGMPEKPPQSFPEEKVEGDRQPKENTPGKRKDKARGKLVPMNGRPKEDNLRVDIDSDILVKVCFKSCSRRLRITEEAYEKLCRSYEVSATGYGKGLTFSCFVSAIVEQFFNDLSSK